MDNPERSISRAAQGLGWASLALGFPQVAVPDTVARLAGVDDLRQASTVIRGVGVRELGHGFSLLLGPPVAVWGRVAGDAIDIAALGAALGSRRRSRRPRTLAALGVVAAITVADVAVALQTLRRRQHGRGRPGPLKLEASITVNHPPEQVYEFWRDFANLPQFMLHLKSVSDSGNGRSHWVANAPAKQSVSWDAQLTGDEPGRRISWRSLPGSTIDNSGTVHFAPAPGDRGTELRVVLHYDIPGGRLGRVVARLFGEEPAQQVRDDLRRFKQVIETGDIVRSDSLPEGTSVRKQFLQRAAQPPPPAKARSQA